MNRLLYTALAALFLVAAASQTVYTIDVVSLLEGDYPVKPFAAGEPWPSARGLGPNARRAGLAEGDRIVAIDGRAVKGAVDIEAPVRAHKPGEQLRVTVLRDGRPADLSIEVPAAADRPSAVFAAVAWMFMPSFSILLGFWVAAVRPRDFRAWLMLGILLGLSQMARNWGLTPLGWGAAIGVPAVLLGTVSVTIWGLSMLLFGIYFPQRWNVDRKAPWVKWILMAGPVSLGLLNLAGMLARAVNVAAGAALPNVRLSDGAAFGILAPCISIFFMATAMKYSDPALGSDDRRRLKLLYWGATTALTPLFLLFLYSLIVNHRAPNPAADGMVMTVALLLIVVFPLTLAYVVVVERAMDVRMVVRQGLQYALAAKGVRVMQGLLVAGVVLFAATAAGEASRPRRIAYVAVGVTLAFGIREFGERLRSWVDRRFFREAYNAEQILRELSEQVRGILDAEALIETVTRKISESFHVEQVAVLLRDGGVFRPALGMAGGVEVAADAVAVRQLLASREAVRVVPEGAMPFHAQLLLPLTGRKELLGFIGLGPKKSEEPYSRADTNLLQTVAAQTGLALENARLSEAIAHEIAEREILNREIDIAREVQQRLFPQTLPEVTALEYAGYCRPARGVGGDYYDFLSLTSGRLGLVIADVSGKGIPAALLMASLQASVRGQSQGGSGQVAELMANVNRLICDASPENRYATFFYGQFDPATRMLVYSNGGHNNPIVIRGAEALRLEVGGPPVGLFQFSRYQQAEVQLEAGDLLVLFTDGVSEAENPAQEEFGEDALEAAARSCFGMPPSEMIQAIIERADAFAAGAPQHDDMTLVIARVS